MSDIQHPNRPPTEKCEGCANRNTTRCDVFCDPEYQHEREGGCYGRREIEDNEQRRAA